MFLSPAILIPFSGTHWALNIYWNFMEISHFINEKSYPKGGGVEGRRKKGRKEGNFILLIGFFLQWCFFFLAKRKALSFFKRNDCCLITVSILWGRLQYIIWTFQKPCYHHYVDVIWLKCFDQNPISGRFKWQHLFQRQWMPMRPAWARSQVSQLCSGLVSE